MFLKKYKTCTKCISFIFRRQFHPNKILKNSQIKTKSSEDVLEKLVETHIDKIVFNTYLNEINPKFSFRKRLELKKVEKINLLEIQSTEPLPSVLKYVHNIPETEQTQTLSTDTVPNSKTHFPFGNETTVAVQATESTAETAEQIDIADSAKLEIEMRQQSFTGIDPSKWMLDYENYDETIEELESGSNWEIKYGTPDPHSWISEVPCGGCGALLHCKDTSIPGYIPSEIFNNASKDQGVQLKALTCQRCHFLKYYNMALQVRVAAEDYPKILETIKKKHALIILAVDLFDFPCSIYPGIVDILGYRKPIVVVGNKVDLIPRDSQSYLNRIQKILEETVKESVGSRAAANIKHVALISAKTGWGVEELITRLHSIWRTRGDIYVVGCTNVGKSSLFNALLQSDFCKVNAVDLIQRATTSLWPGTTMNLLKFPTLRPSGWRLYVRTKRLQALHKIRAAEREVNKLRLKATNDPKYATLVDHIDRTFPPELYRDDEESADPFSVRGDPNASGTVKVGIDDDHPDFASGRWCYDTPGVVHPEQIIHLLTTEELMLTLPRELIQPKTFKIRTGQSIFIAGLGRLDFISGPFAIKLTVFCSKSLPITICDTEHAQLLYEEFLGTELLSVPKGSQDRLSKWPRLKESTLPLLVKGVHRYVGCADIVLSNAGWISVSCNTEATFKGWTPEGRGVYVRKAILPFAVELRGKKLRRSAAYTSEKYFIPK